MQKNCILSLSVPLEAVQTFLSVCEFKVQELLALSATLGLLGPTTYREVRRRKSLKTATLATSLDEKGD